MVVSLSYDETCVTEPEARQGVIEHFPNPPAKIDLFEEMILPHLNAAYNLARWLTRNEADAQDVVQEACLRAFRFFEGYQGGDAKAWLLAVVRNTCHSWRRREKRETPVVPFDEEAHSSRVAGADEPDAEQRMIHQTKVETMRTCIETLPVEYREVLVLRELEEMSYRQIAGVASLPLGTVMSRLARARRRLEECVGVGKSGAVG